MGGSNSLGERQGAAVSSAPGSSAGSSAGSLVAALRAVQIDVAPGRPEMIRWRGAGRAKARPINDPSVGQSRKATATCPHNVTPWLITP